VTEKKPLASSSEARSNAIFDVLNPKKVSAFKPISVGQKGAKDPTGQTPCSTQQTLARQGRSESNGGMSPKLNATGNRAEWSAGGGR
jgi:hypothetical protein